MPKRSRRRSGFGRGGWKGRAPGIAVAAVVAAAAVLIFAPLGAQHAHAPADQELGGVGEPGNGAFAAIQEVVMRLERDPSTDWSAVDLEALRAHLRDMRDFTLEVEVLAKEPVPGGVRLRVRGMNPSAHRSLARALEAHPTALRHEIGWRMDVRSVEDAFEVVVTAEETADEAKIRGLGYIGIMAIGRHHTAHHLEIARGSAPHDH